MTEPGYRAFISYSHRDAAAARALHRRLEAYRIPRRLIGTTGDHGPIPARLTPIFRDRDELPAAGDLSAKVLAALAASRSLIILCSPHAAASPWVAREIEAFRALHPGRPVLAAIVEGEPADCFPAVLGGVQADGTPVEPLAADLRRSGDGQRLGFLKLVAGLAGVGLDALVQRDAARQIRRVTAVTLTALAATLMMAVLTLFALDARREAERQKVQAERQRGEAEGMVEFMLTDLRTKLKGVGRLDALAIVNKRALAYYGDHAGLDRLPDDSLERRARVLQAMGEDAVSRDDVAAAGARFREAQRTTETLLARDPAKPERLFAHSQSEFWLANLDYRAKRYAAARAGFERYKALVDRLVRIAPGRAEWQREPAYAEGSLCALAFETPADAKAALAHCGGALAAIEAVAAGRPKDDPEMLDALISRHAWAARAWGANARPDKAMEHLRAQLDLADRLVGTDPSNRDHSEQWVRAQMAMAETLAETGQTAAAAPYRARALQKIGDLRRVEPANARWRALEVRIRKLASGEM
ncbi:MAG: TIR domain-containing protein [Pseudomonadota bacterium]